MLVLALVNGWLFWKVGSALADARGGGGFSFPSDLGLAPLVLVPMLGGPPFMALAAAWSLRRARLVGQGRRRGDDWLLGVLLACMAMWTLIGVGLLVG